MLLGSFLFPVWPAFNSSVLHLEQLAVQLCVFANLHVCVLTHIQIWAAGCGNDTPWENDINYPDSSHSMPVGPYSSAHIDQSLHCATIVGGVCVCVCTPTLCFSLLLLGLTHEDVYYNDLSSRRMWDVSVVSVWEIKVSCEGLVKQVSAISLELPVRASKWRIGSEY